MAIIYKVKQASKANKEGKKLYHPSTVHIGLVTTAQMAKHRSRDYCPDGKRSGGVFFAHGR